MKSKPKSKSGKSKSGFNIKDIMAPNAPAGPMPAAAPTAPVRKKKKSAGSDVIGQPTPVGPPNPMGGMY